MKTGIMGAGLAAFVLGLMAVGVVGDRGALATVQAGSTVPKGMVLIPAGRFLMGDSFGEGWGDELPVHRVYVSAFYMGTHEVTKALWDEVALWAQAQGYDIGPSDGSGATPDHPVCDVSWYEAVKWCNARSEKEGLTPCYTTGGLTYRRGQSTPECNWGANGYRLPTEAEWERAARGGCESRRFPWCDTDTIQHSRANYYSSAQYPYDTSPTRGFHPVYGSYIGGGTSPVGSFAANGYGLYDVAGNVWEWCWDWYAPRIDVPGFEPSYYEVSPESDPRGPSAGVERVCRGGGAGSSAKLCRVACRFCYKPETAFLDLGFRVVRAAR